MGEKKWEKVHPTEERRAELGVHRLVQELRLDKERFHCYFHMSQEQFRLFNQSCWAEIISTDNQLQRTSTDDQLMRALTDNELQRTAVTIYKQR